MKNIEITRKYISYVYENCRSVYNLLEKENLFIECYNNSLVIRFPSYDIDIDDDTFHKIIDVTRSFAESEDDIKFAYVDELCVYETHLWR